MPGGPEMEYCGVLSLFLSFFFFLFVFPVVCLCLAALPRGIGLFGDGFGFLVLSCEEGGVGRYSVEGTVPKVPRHSDWGSWSGPFGR